MRIPQYEQRIIADPARRTQINITEPKEFSDTAHLNRMTKQGLDTATEFGEAYLEMKQQRDKGIVNEFGNIYETDKANKVAELRSKYKGANSTKMVDEFSKWHNDYLATHLGLGHEAGKDTLVLENDAQIEGARQLLANDLPTSINSLSSYAATELNEYAKNQFDGRMFLLQDKVSKERDENNLGIYVSSIKNGMADYYSGQSSEYIAMQSQKMIGSALATNVRNDLTNNPVLAIQKINNKVFTDNLSGDDINTLSTDIISALKETDSLKVAKARLDGKEISTALTPDELSVVAPFLGKHGGFEKYAAEVSHLAENKKMSLAIEQRNQENQAINSTNERVVKNMKLLNSNIISAEDRVRLEQDLNNTLSALSSMGLGGQSLANVYNNAYLGVNERTYWQEQWNRYASKTSPITNPEERAKAYQARDKLRDINKRIKQEYGIVTEIINRIKNNEYSDFRDLGIEQLHGYNQFVVLEALAENNKYKRFEVEAGRDGFKVDKTCSDYFTKTSKTKPEDNPLYRRYKQEFKDAVLIYKKNNGKYPDDVALLQLSREAYNSAQTGSKTYIDIVDIADDIPSIREDVKKDNGVISDNEVLQKVTLKMTAKDVFGVLNVDEIEEVANLIINGRLEQAERYMKGIIDYGN